MVEAHGTTEEKKADTFLTSAKILDQLKAASKITDGKYKTLFN